MIAIITAMSAESAVFVEKFSLQPIAHPRLNLRGNEKTIVCECGAGKVNSAIATTDLLATFSEISLVISSGVVGALAENLEIGDIVIGRETAQHDGYIPAEFSGTDLNEPLPLQFFEVENTKPGKILSGDQFIHSAEKKSELAARGGTICEMECAAVAHAARKFKIPCAAIKIVSDKADNSACLDFENNFRTVMEHAVKVLETVIEKFDASKT